MAKGVSIFRIKQATEVGSFESGGTLDQYSDEALQNLCQWTDSRRCGL